MQHAKTSENTNYKNTEQFTNQILVQFTQELDAESIDYCCWPSINQRKPSETSAKSFDLLIKQADRQRCNEIILVLGFKEMHFHEEKSTADRVQNYLGYNPSSGELLCFRVTSKLILGDLSPNNYHLPIEISTLESAVRDGLVKTCSADIALVLFVFSMVLKYSSNMHAFKKHHCLSSWETKELEQRTAQTSHNASEISQLYLNSANEAIFENCLSLLQSDASILSRIQTGHQLRKYLLISSGYSPWLAKPVGWWHLAAGFLVPTRVTAAKQKPHTNGALVAIVGSDGAGKSTAVNSLHEWISNYCRIVGVHLGKPPKSISSFIVHSIIRAGRLSDRIFKHEWFSGSVADINVPLVIRYFLLLRSVLIAKDRLITYRKARNLANKGALVISDRFPLTQIKLMDGSLSGQLVKFKKQPDKIVEFLLNMEKKYYAPIHSPELLIVLRVDPEIAIQRRSDENTAIVRPRAQEVWETDWQNTSAHVVDANQSPTEVMSELKSLIWTLL